MNTSSGTFREIVDLVFKHRKIFIVQILAPTIGIFVGGGFALLTSATIPFAIICGLVITLLINIPVTAVMLIEAQENFATKSKTDLDEVGRQITSEATKFREWNANLLSSRYRIAQVDPSELNHRITIALKESTLVKNTYVNLHQITGASTVDGKDVSRWYQEFLDRGARLKWIDVTGVGDFLDGRYHRINLAASAIDATHELNIISDSLPIINFMIIEKPRASADVFFGWLQDDSAQSTVYHSDDPRIGTLFANYFNLLCSYRKASVTKVDYSLVASDRFGGLAIENIRGIWLSVSANKSITNASQYTKYSIIKIGFVNGEWKVDGVVYERANLRPVQNIKSVSASVLENGIFYQFERAEPDGRHSVKGHGTYVILPTMPLFPSTEKKIAKGAYFVEERHPAHETRAIKICDAQEFKGLTEAEADNWLELIQASISRRSR